MSSKGRVLVVDDEKNLTLIVQAMLEKAGFEVICSNDSVMACQLLKDEEFDVLVTDLFMPVMTGMDLLLEVQRTQPELPVVMMTAYGTVESAVSALKRGAFDYISKPFDQAELIQSVRKASLTHKQRLNEPVLLEGTGSSHSMIGAGPSMQEVFRLISKVAPSSSTILITGESGTGKELVAFQIHKQSTREKKAFIKINCAAIPATLIESELFGHEKGAFTGAVGTKPGRFELANEGTLFLDEVAEMPLEMQAKLLRVLQEHEFERVGGVSTIKVDVRIVAATNKDLAHEVAQGRFREDLYYRLNVVPIHLPPLRERKEDIELLLQVFVGQFNKKLDKNIERADPRVLGLFKKYSWPGNVRQFENVIERMVLLADSNVLEIDELPEDLAVLLDQDPQDVPESLPEGDSFKEIVRKKTQSVEKELIEKALLETEGNVTKAAEKLGLSRKGLQIKMKELGVKREINSSLNE